MKYLLIFICIIFIIKPLSAQTTPVDFNDPNFEAAVREALSIPTETITQGDMQSLLSLNATEDSIYDISGIEYANNLTSLTIHSNFISDLSPLENLSQIRMLSLSNNEISDIAAISNLTSLQNLWLNDNLIDDITPISQLTSLQTLFLGNNLLDNEDLPKLYNLDNLMFSLDLDGNIGFTEPEILKLADELPELSVDQIVWNPLKPRVTLSDSVEVTCSTAMIKISVNPYYSETSIKIRYGTDSSLIRDVSIILDNYYQDRDIFTEYQLNSLIPNTTYYVQMAATNDGGVSETKIIHFHTRPSPPDLVSPRNGDNNISVVPRFKWNKANSNLVYEITVSEQNDFSSPIISTNQITDTLYQSNSSLNYNQTYYWRVKSYNDTLSSLWSRVYSFSTVPPPDTCIIRGNLILNGGPAPIGTLVSIYNSDYSIKYMEFRTTETGSYSASLINDFDYGPFENDPVQIKINSLNLINDSTIRYQPAQTIEFNIESGCKPAFSDTTIYTSTVITGDTSSIYEFSLQKMGTDTLRIDSITCDNHFLLSLDSINWGTRISDMALPMDTKKNISIRFIPDSAMFYSDSLLIYSNYKPDTPQSINLQGYGYIDSIITDTVIHFGNIYESSNYQLIGLPGNQSIALNAIIKGEYQKDWKAFYDTGQDTAYPHYLVEYDSSQLFNFKPGNAFWIISETEIQLKDTLKTVGLDSNHFYSIGLHEGWNILSNPFNKKIAVNDIISANQLDENTIFWKFNQTLQESDSLAPFQGYYFYNELNLPKINFPYFQSEHIFHKKNIPAEYSELEITLTNPRNHSSQRILTTISNGKQTPILMPPIFFSKNQISIIDDSLPQKPVYHSFKPIMNQGVSFQLKITCEPNSGLCFNKKKKFKNYQIILKQNHSSTWWNLKDNQKIIFEKQQNNRLYTLLIGTEDYINQYLSEEKIDLKDQNIVFKIYPNPSSGVIHYQFQGLQGSTVSVTVYSIDGKEVHRTTDQNINSNSYKTRLNLQHFSQGIYFLKLTAKKNNSLIHQEIKKIIIIK